MFNVMIICPNDIFIKPLLGFIRAFVGARKHLPKMMEILFHGLEVDSISKKMKSTGKMNLPTLISVSSYQMVY